MSNISDVEFPRWYALNVRYQSEYRIADILKQKIGIEVAVPSRPVWSGRAGKRISRMRPLLDTYVFIQANLARIELKRLYSVSGVVDFVRSHSTRKPASIPGEQIDALVLMAEAEIPVHEIEYRSKLKENDEVDVVGGPLVGSVGRFLRADSVSGRFVVLLDLFNRALVADVDARHVRRR